MDVLDIREELLNLIDNSDADDEFWQHAETEASMRNSFALRLQPDGRIFTVTITVGGALTS